MHVKRLTNRPPDAAKIPATSLVHPNSSTAKLDATQPYMMNGLLRPSWDLHESLRMPTTGWTINPLRGPAINTIAIIA